jgi:plastocyanin
LFGTSVTSKLAVVVVALSAVACGGGGSGTTKTAVGGTIDVSAFDIHYDVQTIKASTGVLTINLHDKGALEHTFTIEGQNFEIKVNSSHRDLSKSVTLAKGTYTFECSVDSHAAQGMKGKIVVN